MDDLFLNQIFPQILGYSEFIFKNKKLGLIIKLRSKEDPHIQNLFRTKSIEDDFYLNMFRFIIRIFLNLFIYL